MDEKTYKLDILAPAQAEMEEIARVHMALSGSRSARRVTNRIYHAMDQLTRFPLSGPIIQDDELRTAGFRYIIAETYLIFYRFSEGAVIVYHIAHGATDYPKLFR